MRPDSNRVSARGGLRAPSVLAQLNVVAEKQPSVEPVEQDDAADERLDQRANSMVDRSLAPRDRRARPINAPPTLALNRAIFSGVPTSGHSTHATLTLIAGVAKRTACCVLLGALTALVCAIARLSHLPALPATPASATPLSCNLQSARLPPLAVDEQGKLPRGLPASSCAERLTCSA
jgi:hypothetical protein